MAEGLIYFRDGKLVAESGDVRAYIMNGKFYLEKGRGHSLWTHEDEIKEYIYQLKDYPKGECLEIGLGLGVASKYILSFPLVDSLTTVELDENIIKVQREVNYINDERHLVLNANGLFYAYQTKKKFDFIFLDFYSHIDEETLPAITDMSIACKRLLKPKAVMTGWLDPGTLEEHMKLFYKLFD